MNLYFFVRHTCNVLIFLLFKVRIVTSDLEIRKQVPPCIFASNHVSNFDPFLIGIKLQYEINYFSKIEIRKNLEKIFPKRMVRKCDNFNIFIDRQNLTLSVIKSCIHSLKIQKRPLLIFPEGSRNQKKKVNYGIGWIIKKTQVPIVPIYIDIQKSKRSLFSRKNITLYIGEITHIDYKKTKEEISQQIIQEIYQFEKNI